MEFKNIKLDINENKYALVTICRENVCNALDEDTVSEINNALDIISEDNTLRAVVLTGKGYKYFSAGADLKKLKKKTSLQILESGLQSLCSRIESFKLPVIAAVNGYALGGGMEVVLSCDFRVSSENAVFGLPEVNLGVIPSAGGTQRLSYLVGTARAKQVILLGDRIHAEEAKALGIVYEIAEKEELLLAAEKIVNKLISKSPMAVYLAKSSINIASSAGNEFGMKYEKMCQAVLANHPDREEGIRAFYEKRPPEYKVFK